MDGAAAALSDDMSATEPSPAPAAWPTDDADGRRDKGSRRNSAGRRAAQPRNRRAGRGPRLVSDSPPPSDEALAAADSAASHQLPRLAPAPEVADVESNRAAEAEPGPLEVSNSDAPPAAADHAADAGAAEALASTFDEALRAGESTDSAPDAGVSADASPGDGALSEADGSPDAGAVTPLQIVEAILFATETPLTAGRIADVLGVGTARDVRKHVAALNEQYGRIGTSFRIQEIAGGFQMRTLPVYHVWLGKLNKAKQDTRLSTAALETLAAVAYKQPVTRADVEAIRGVASGEMLNRLRELDLVKIVGRAEDLGRPLLYGTTKHFLEVFGLGGLSELPQIDSPVLKPPPAAPVAVQSTPDASVSPATDASAVPADDAADSSANQ